MSKPYVVPKTEPTERYVGPMQSALKPGTSPTASLQPESAVPLPPKESVAAVAADIPAFVPKVYQPRDIACPHQNPDMTNCGAGAGEPCNWQLPGMDGTYHAERIADAGAASQRDGIKTTQEQFDQAAADSELF